MGAPFQRGAGLLTEPSRWARAKRWLKWLSVGLFVLLLVLGGVVASVVATAPGLRTALRLALPQINELIAGEIAVERVEGALTDRLNLYGVTITAPDGTVALRAERITVEVLLSKLLHKRALVRELEIVRPEVTLYDKAGAIAFASAFDTGEPASEDAGPSPWVVRLQDVTLSSGALRLKPDAQPMVDELTLAFGLTVAGGEIAWEGVDLHLKTHHAKFSEAVALQATGSFGDRGLQLLHLDLIAGPHQLSAVVSGPDLGRLVFRLSDLDATVQLPALAPFVGRPLMGVAALAGSASGDGRGVTAKLTLKTPAGTLDINGHLALSTLEWRADIAVANLRPQAVLPLLPVDPQGALQLLASGAGNPVGTGWAAATLELKALEGLPLPFNALSARGGLVAGELHSQLVLDTDGPEQWIVSATMPSVTGNHIYAQADVSDIQPATWEQAKGRVAGAIPHVRAHATVTLGKERTSVAGSALIIAGPLTVTAPEQPAMQVQAADITVDLKWPGAGPPTGTFDLRVAGFDGMDTTARTVTASGLLQPRATGFWASTAVAVTDIVAPGGVIADGLSVVGTGELSGELQLRDAKAMLNVGAVTVGDIVADGLTLNLDTRRVGTTLEIDGPLVLGAVTPTADTAVGGAVGSVKLRRPDDGTPRVVCSLVARRLSLGTAGRLEKATLQLDATLSKTPNGSASLLVDNLVVAGVQLDQLSVTAQLPKTRRQGGLTLAARRGHMKANADIELTFEKGLDGPIDARLDRLEVGDGRTGAKTTPGARFRWDPTTGVDIHDLKLRRLVSRVPELTLDGSFAPETGAVDVKAHLSHIDLRSWMTTLSKVLGRSIGDDIAGVVNGHVALSGSVTAPLGRAKLNLVGGRFGDVRGLTAGVDVSLTRRAVAAELKAGWGRTRIDGRVTAPLRGTRVPDRGTVKLRVLDLDLQAVGELIGQPIGGMARATIDLSGKLTAPKGSATVQVNRLRHPQIKPRNLTVKFSADDGVSLDTPGLRLSVKPLHDFTQVVRALRTGRWRDAMVEVGIDVTELSLADIQKDGLPLTINGSLTASGSVATLAPVGTLEAHNLPGPWPNALATAVLGIQEARSTVSVALTTGDTRLVSAVATLPATLAAVGLAPEPLKVLSSPHFRIDVLGTWEREGLDVLQPGLRGQIEAWVPKPKLSVQGDLVGGPEGLSIHAAAVLRAGETPPGTLVEQLVLGVEIGPTMTTASVRATQARTRGDMHIKAQTEIGTRRLLTGELPDWMVQPFTGSIKATGWTTDDLPLKFHALEENRGRFQADVVLSGSATTPRMVGALAVTIPTLKFRDTDVIQNDVNARLEFAGDTIRLLPTRLKTGAGHLNAEMTVVVPTLKPTDIRLSGKVAMEKFQALATDTLRATLTGSVALTGTVAAPEVDGKIRIDEAFYKNETGGRDLQPMTAPKDVVFAEQREAVAAKAEEEERARSEPTRLKLNLKIEIPPRAVHIMDDRAEIWAQGDLLAATAADGLTVIGYVAVDEGTVVVMGRRFELERESKVLFGGNKLTDPSLDVRARFELGGYDLTALDSTSEDPHILLTVSGKVSAPKIVFASLPEMTQTQILGLLTLGTVIGADSGDDGAGDLGVGNLVMSAVASNVARAIQERLPVDIVRIDTPTGRISEARLTVGQRLTDNLILYYEANLGAGDEQNTNEVRLQYEILRNLTVDGRVGDAGVGAVDLLWKFRF